MGVSDHDSCLGWDLKLALELGSGVSFLRLELETEEAGA